MNKSFKYIYHFIQNYNVFQNRIINKEFMFYNVVTGRNRTLYYVLLWYNK